MTFRSRRCFAMRSRAGGAGRASPMSPAPPRSRCCWPGSPSRSPIDKRIAAIFVASAAVTFVMLRLVAALIMWGAAKLPRARMTALRLAIANIHRPGALTPSVVLSLGLGLAVLVIVVQIDGNLRRQFQQSLPDKSPAFFFVDIQNSEAPQFDAFIHKAAPDASVDRVPMLRGRIVSANGDPRGRIETFAAGGLGAAKRSRRDLCGDHPVGLADRGRRMVADGLFRAAAALDGEADRGRPWAEGRRHADRQRARPQHLGAHRQSAQRRLADARHQFRAGLFAQYLPRRAAYAYCNPDIPRATPLRNATP